MAGNKSNTHIGTIVHMTGAGGEIIKCPLTCYPGIETGPDYGR
jgi:hypothetical protein